jgi:hypothetical protein
MSIFSTVENLSKRYWSHDHQRHRVVDESLEKTVEDFRLIENQIGNNVEHTASVALKELWRCIVILQQSVGRENDFLLKQALSITLRIENLMSQYPYQMGEHLDAIKAHNETIKRLCLNPNTGIYKGAVISSILTELNDKNEVLLLLAKNKDALDGLKKICSNLPAINVEVRSMDELPDAGNFTSAVVSSWTGPKSIDKLVRSNLVNKYHIVGYDHELAWAEGYFNRVHAFPSSHIVSPADKKVLYPNINVDWPVRIIPPVSEKAASVIRMADSLNKVRKHYSNFKNEGADDPVSVKYCDLSGDYFAYLSLGYTANVVVLRGNTVTVKEVHVDNLEEDQMLMFRGESEEGAVSSIVDSSYPDSKKLREIAKIWHNEIKQRFAKASELHRAVVYAGEKIALNTAQIWHGGWLRIAPEDKNLDVLAKVLGNKSETYRRIDEIKNAAHTLSERHTIAGQTISNALKAKIAEWRGDITDIGASIRVPQLGQVDLVVIEGISPTEETQDRSLTNRLLKQD